VRGAPCGRGVGPRAEPVLPCDIHLAIARARSVSAVFLLLSITKLNKNQDSSSAPYTSSMIFLFFFLPNLPRNLARSALKQPRGSAMSLLPSFLTRVRKYK